MTNTDSLREDIAYVRAAAERADTGTIPSICLLWAVIGLCGGVLADFAADSRWVGRFWLAAAPAGTCLSLWLGFRAGRRDGQASRRTGVRWGLRWLAFMAAGALGAALVAAGHLQWSGFGSLVALFLALSYAHAGFYLDRRLLPVAGVLGTCYLVTLFVPGYQWTLAGVLMAAALVWQAILGARQRDARRS